MAHDHLQTWPGNSHRAQRMPRWYEWLIAVVLVLAVVGHFVIRPAVESVLQRIGQGFSVLVQGISQFAQSEYLLACDRVEHDPQLAVLLGQPAVCPPIEQVQWLGSQGREEFAFSFPVSGPLGSGEAHVVVPIVGDQPGPASITVTLPNKISLLLAP